VIIAREYLLTQSRIIVSGNNALGHVLKYVRVRFEMLKGSE
jgi:hypothetical protein